MRDLKDGIRSHVRIDFFGHVHKHFKGTNAAERCANEARVLKILEERDCPFVPRLLEYDASQDYIVTTNCGRNADNISRGKADSLFASLEKDFGVRHGDAEPRNVTYSPKLGCFCIIDFELAEVLPWMPVEEKVGGSSFSDSL